MSVRCLAGTLSFYRRGVLREGSIVLFAAPLPSRLQNPTGCLRDVVDAIGRLQTALDRNRT